MGYEEAKARVAALEKNPKHTTPTPQALEETRDDPLPTKDEHPVPLDPGWKKSSDGTWDHPNHRKEDED